MAGPEYDFFATGPRQAPPQPPAPPVGRTASPSVPAAPMTGAPAPVNQFGLPVDEYAPTGPYAAPGYGTVPVAHGLVASQDPAWGAPAGRRQAPAPADVRPGTVLAAGIISIVLGALGAVLAGMGLLGYAAMSAQLDQLAAASDDSATAAAFGSAILGAVLVGVVVLAVFAALYLVLGIMTARGSRPFAWALLVVSALNLLWSAYQFVSGSMGTSGTGGTFSTVVGLGVVVAIVLLLTVGSGGAWLRRS
jgi:hypothetical protein